MRRRAGGADRGGRVPRPLLKTFPRTGDERWLERARRFAVHALTQVERLRAARGRGRYSLWTGDVGTVLHAAACLDADARYPVLDALTSASPPRQVTVCY